MLGEVLMNAEKRASLRIPLSVVVTYRVDQQDRIDTYTVESVNIGEGGILLKTTLPLGIGTRVMLEFALPGSAEVCCFNGEVVWTGGVHASGEAAASGKGIKFLDPDPRLRKRLFELLREEP
jgi:Tfp pilus assembly protein PilZ